MFISVIIPTYNRAAYIGTAMDSVLNQTYGDFELLVVDDHSTDETEQIVKRYDDPRITLMKNSRKKGAQGARNTGLYAAKGEWVAMLDSDDAWLPEKLATMVEAIGRHDETLVGLSSANATYDFEAKKIIKKKRLHKTDYKTEDLLYRNYLDGFSSFMFKRNSGLACGGFDESLPALQDIDFYITLSLKGKIGGVPKVLTLIRKSNKDRISRDYETKYDAYKLLKNKYKGNFAGYTKIVARKRCVSLLFALRADKPFKVHLKSLFIMLFLEPSLILKIVVKFGKKRFYKNDG